MATIEKRGDGFRIRWRDPDGKARSRQCPSARIARELLREVEEAGARGKRWTPSAAARHPLLRDLIAAYLRDLNRTHRPRTVTRAHAALGPFVAWMQQRMRVEDVTTDALSRSIVAEHDTHLVERGIGVSSRRTSAWAIGSCWRWGWAHPDWRPSLAEPAMPRMPTVVLTEVVAATWAQLDAVVDRAETQAAAVPSREWVRRAVLLMRGLGSGSSPGSPALGSIARPSSTTSATRRGSEATTSTRRRCRSRRWLPRSRVSMACPRRRWRPWQGLAASGQRRSRPTNHHSPGRRRSPSGPRAMRDARASGRL